MFVYLNTLLPKCYNNSYLNRYGIGEAYAGVHRTWNLKSKEVQRQNFYKEDIVIYPSKYLFCVCLDSKPNNLLSF